MINRTNEFVYVKRYYFLPFKPFMDFEYKKFGYKRCDGEKGKEKYINSSYYVCHKERPSGLCDTLYTLNLPFSYYRSLVFPIQVALFFISMLIEGTIGIRLFLAEQLVWSLLVIPSMIISAILASKGENAYRRNDTNGKLDRIMKSQGWDLWTSYKDNDPRFKPPGSGQSAGASSTLPKNSSTKPQAVNDEDNDECITLLSANEEEIDFKRIATINYRGKSYAILQPFELLEGMADDEALVFRTTPGPNGADTFEIELDDNIIDAVFKEYDRLYDKKWKR